MKKIIFSCASSILALTMLLTGCDSTDNPTSSNSEQANALPKYKEKQHYRYIAKPNSVKPDEVVQFFWFGSKNTQNLEPDIKKWQASNKNGKLVRIPLSFRKEWMFGAQVYYTLEELSMLDTYFDKVLSFFKTAALSKKIVVNKENFNLFLANENISVSSFWEVFNSNRVKEKIKAGDKLAQLAQVKVIPSILVSGKYLIRMGSVDSFDEVFDVVDYLLVNRPISGSY